MSNLIPSAFQRQPPPAQLDAEGLPLPLAPPTDCQMCRITGTATFSAVGLYALVQACTAKTQAGKGVVVLAGLGFLTVAAARWTQGERLGLGEPRASA